MLTTYWDLTEKERAALTETDVERYLDAELMTKGVLKVRPLELLPEPALPEPAGTFFILKNEGFQDLDLAFATADAARAAMGAAQRLTSAYVGSKSYPVAEPLRRCEVVVQSVYTSEQIQAAKRDFEKVGEIRTENGRRQKRHEEESAKEREALSGLWSDWHQCRAKSREMERVFETFREYEKIAGDQGVARRFLSKAFDIETLKDASEWHGVRLHTDATDFDAPAMPMPAEARP